MAQKNVVSDSAFNALIAYLGGDPKDFSLTSEARWIKGKWAVFLTAQNLADPDIDPIVVRLLPDEN